VPSWKPPLCRRCSPIVRRKTAVRQKLQNQISRNVREDSPPALVGKLLLDLNNPIPLTPFFLLRWWLLIPVAPLFDFLDLRYHPIFINGTFNGRSLQAFGFLTGLPCYPPCLNSAWFLLTPAFRVRRRVSSRPAVQQHFFRPGTALQHAFFPPRLFLVIQPSPPADFSPCPPTREVSPPAGKNYRSSCSLSQTSQSRFDPTT